MLRLSALLASGGISTNDLYASGMSSVGSGVMWSHVVQYREMRLACPQWALGGWLTSWFACGDDPQTDKQLVIAYDVLSI